MYWDTLYREKIQSAYCESTARNFKYQCEEFVNFCAAHALQIFPPVELNVARYLTCASTKVSAYSTIMNKLSAVKKFYHMYGYELKTAHPAIDLLTKACKREMSSESKPKAPIEPGHIILISHMIDPSDINHQLFLNALLVQFFSCVRKSNLLPASLRTFSPHKQLTSADIHVTQDGLVLTLPWTKTLQNNDDIVTIAIAQVPGSILDPVSSYITFIRQFPMPPGMPAFSAMAGTQIKVLTQQVYIDTLKLFLKRLGLPPEAYSSHSIRRGAATALFNAGCSQKLIKYQGGWKSNCYERYISMQHSDKLVPTKKLLNHINLKYGNNK